MGKYKEIAADLGNLLRLRNKRVRLEVEKAFGLDSLTVFVSGRDLGYMRRVLIDIVPMGVYVDVKRLKFWECRVKKIQLPEGF